MGHQESGIEDGKSKCRSAIYVVGGIGEEEKSVNPIQIFNYSVVRNSRITEIIDRFKRRLNRFYSILQFALLFLFGEVFG